MRQIFVQTENVKNFISAMKEAENAVGDPVLLVFYGQAGRGKTETARFFAAQEGWIYCRAMKGWKSELWMLQDLCFEMNVDPIPGRRKTAFDAIKESLRSNPRPVLLDDTDKMNESLLEWVRDLADVTFVPIALIGEKLIVHKMQRERRIWSRTLRAVSFEAISAKDILYFARQAADISLTAQQANMFRESSDGDYRLVKRDLRKLEEIWIANGKDQVTDEMVKMAIKLGLRGA
ncbi:MAG: ATP-binding protein [Deltaproteobacteria bacterium]|nr:ATP-binding protein [Deltaproteobacteria bacterium]